MNNTEDNKQLLFGTYPANKSESLLLSWGLSHGMHARGQGRRRERRREQSLRLMLENIDETAES